MRTEKEILAELKEQRESIIDLIRYYIKENIELKGTSNISVVEGMQLYKDELLRTDNGGKAEDAIINKLRETPFLIRHEEVDLRGQLPSSMRK